MDSDTSLVAAASTAVGDGGDTEKDNQHRQELRKLKRDLYALNRANENLQSENQQLTMEFNGRSHEFTMQQLDLQQREIDQHLELIGLSASLKAIAGETDITLIAAKITEQIRIVEDMAARRVAISDNVTPTPSKKRKRSPPSGSEAANENGQGSSADSLGGEWSAMLEPPLSSSSITLPSVNTSPGPIPTPSTPIQAANRRGRRLPKKSIDRTKVLDRRLGDYPDDYVMETGTVAWAKIPSYPWYPGIVFLDEDIRDANLQVPIPVSAKFKEKSLKTPHVPHFIIYFFDYSWACLPLSSLKKFGEIPELDRDMVAVHSQFQGKWTGKRHSETQNAYKKAMDHLDAIGSDS